MAGWQAVVISVTMVLLFGEILPSAVMTGPKQLQLSAAMATPTWYVCMLACSCTVKMTDHRQLQLSAAMPTPVVVVVY